MTDDHSDYYVFIISRGRPNSVATVESGFKRSNFTGRWCIVLDDEDETIDEYVQRYGNDRVVVFSKSQTMAGMDMGDNFGISGSVVPRRAIWQIAKDMGIDYFIVLDDDYNEFRWKFDQNNQPAPYTLVGNLDAVFQALVDCYSAMPPSVLTLSLLQQGDFIGGFSGDRLQKITAFRKAMNVFVCSTFRQFEFPARMNEDVNAYTEVQRRGYAFLSINRVAFNQLPTQRLRGGMTDIYLEQGTYVKTFYSIMRCPSGVKVSVLGDRNVNPRIHHRVTYNRVAPKIIPHRFQKPDTLVETTTNKTAI